MKARGLLSIFLCICICLAFTACCNCTEYNDEQYPEADTLSLLSPPLRNLQKLYSDLGELEADLTADRAYRMFYKHSFERYSYIIRLERNSVGCKVMCIKTQAVETKGKWRNIPVSKTQKTLPIDNWIKFEDLMEQAGFWSSPQVVDRQGLDGYGMVLEGYRPDAEACGKRGYHLIHRWSPEAGPPADAVALLLEYAEIDYSSQR